MGISSTINIPNVKSGDIDPKAFAEVLAKYAHRLRGFTCYPDGARGGQPLTVVTYRTAMGHEGVVFEESEDKCVGGVCGI
jgi:ribonucleoside-diphosphate reductase alpha chain